MEEFRDKEERIRNDSRRRVHPTMVGRKLVMRTPADKDRPGPSTGSGTSSNEEIKKRLADQEVSEEEIKIYTDGACYRNGKIDAQASIGVWFGPEHELNVSKVVPVGHRQTNNTAEILAAVEAVAQARKLNAKRICIASDSNLLVQAWNQSVPHWQNNEWKTASGKPVQHRREFCLLIEEVAKVPGLVLRMEHVLGHSDCLGNVGADALATAAIQRYVEKVN